MSGRSGWRSARGHLVFLAALVSAFALVWWLERWEGGAAAPAGVAWEPSADLRAPPPPLAPLDAEGRAAAEAAWAYFDANIQPATGLADAVAGYPSATMWDTGSFLLAAIAAERLGVLPRARFDAVVGAALDSLGRMPLFDGRLPNKAYDTATLAMVDYDNRPAAEGIGWSALDVARLIVPLDILLRHEPGHAAAAQAVLDRLDLGAALDGGRLVGARPGAEAAGYARVQEGRIGYEQYGARAFALLGLDASEAARPEPNLGWAEVEGIEVPVDTRPDPDAGLPAVTLSEPYLLTALEYGWDARGADLAWRVFRAQEARHAATGVLTAVSEDHLDRAPRFVFGAVVAGGTPWAVLTPDGTAAPDLRVLSTKAALGWDALYGDDYTAALAQAVAVTRTPEGWQAGLYEATGAPDAVLAANTNAVVLEALHWRVFGPMLNPTGLPAR